MDKKFFVPFETARQLKEKGYPQDKSDYGYFDNGDSHPLIMFPADNFDCAAPTYHEVLDWLEWKGIYISIMYFKVRIAPWVATIDGKVCDCINGASTREETLNAAIIKALEML